MYIKFLSRFILVVLFVGFVAARPQGTHLRPPISTAKSWWDHVKFLADDKLEGRDTGSRGEREAKKYAVEQLKKAGAEPAGRARFLSASEICFAADRGERIRASRSFATASASRWCLARTPIISTRVMPAPEVSAPLVFAGYGLKVPENNYDDFAGLDLQGKIAVIFSGSPAEIPGALASHYQTMAERWKALRTAGAVGVRYTHESGLDGYSMVAHCPQPHPSVDGSRLSEFNETRRRQTGGDINPGKRGKTLCRLRPHLCGNRRARQRAQGSAAFCADWRFARGKNAR